MGLKSLLDRNEEPSDEESEREALRRQRLEAASELASIKRTLAERVAEVQQRERELADALARVEKREQKLEATGDRGSRLDSVRLRLAEAKEARSSLDERRAELDAKEQALAAREAAAEARAGDSVDSNSVDSTQAPPLPAASEQLDARAAKLDAREAELAKSANALADRETELSARQIELDALSAELAEREHAIEANEEESVDSTQAPEVFQPDELAQIEVKLAELREAEQAFARTQHELAARSDAFAEQEAELAKRERELAAEQPPAPSPDIEALDARIRRLEQGSRRVSTEESQTFSAGLRALQERGLRGGREPEEPLH